MALSRHISYENVVSAGSFVRVGKEPFSYKWLPNGAKCSPHGHGWAFKDDTPDRRKALTPQARHAYACARWLLRGQLLASRFGQGVCAVIRRHEGYYHFIEEEWRGPYQWRYTGPDSHMQCFILLPVRKWVALFGELPDLPARAFAA